MEQRQSNPSKIPDCNLLYSYHQKLEAWTLRHPDAKYDEITQQARKIAEEVGI